ncbi:unnamed protein product [Musa acuminata subsp. burmannicoides]
MVHFIVLKKLHTSTGGKLVFADLPATLSSGVDGAQKRPMQPVIFICIDKVCSMPLFLACIMKTVSSACKYSMLFHHCS